MKNQEDNRTGISYYFHFVARAFLIAVLGMMILSGLLITVYLADLFFHVKDDGIHAPLFGAYIIVSPSMVPTIKVNDMIVIKRQDHDRYYVGDIITFASLDHAYEGLTVTHRVVNKQEYEPKKSFYTTKGDNNDAVDPALVTTDSIYGRVLFKIPKVGYIQEFFAKPMNLFLCLLIPTGIVFLYDFTRIFIAMIKRNKA